MPSRSGAGAARSVSPIGRNIKNCSKTKVPINKERFASIYKEPLRGTLNRPPPSAPSAQTPLLTKEYHQPPAVGPKNSKKVGELPSFKTKHLRAYLLERG